MRKRIEDYIKLWENRCYRDGLPDEAPAEISDMVPSYKRIAIAILRNDHSLKYLGLTPRKSEFYTILKGIEIRNRENNAVQP